MRVMAKVFNDGDKVFAKMRGYPAWPARVEGVAELSPKNTKYHVFFYGTLQRGVCKTQEIFPYAENKSKYGKSTKRKGFQEALDQIEGNAPVPQLVPKIVTEKLTNGICKPKTDTETAKNVVNNSDDCLDNKNEGKRKCTSNIISKQAECDGTSTPAVNNNDGIKSHTSKQSQKNQKGQNSVQKRKTRQTSESDNNRSSGGINKTQKLKKGVICDDDDEEEEEEDADDGDDKDDDDDDDKESSDSNTQMSVDTIASQGSQSERNAKSKSCELPLNSDSPDNPEKQMKESQNGSETVSRFGRIIKKRSFPDEIVYPTPKRKRNCNPNNNNSNHQCQHQEQSSQDEVRMQETRSEDAIVPREPLERKQTACKMLATENCLARLDALVRAQLCKKKPNPQACIRFLDDMYGLDLRPLMLKRHPEVVETIKRLRKYVGNLNEWNYSEEQRKTFEEQACQIRQKAQCLFDKFKVMYSAPDISTFLQQFADSVIDFEELTRHWPLTKTYALVNEPKCRRTTGQKVQTNNKDS